MKLSWKVFSLSWTCGSLTLLVSNLWWFVSWNEPAKSISLPQQVGKIHCSTYQVTRKQKIRFLFRKILSVDLQQWAVKKPTHLISSPPKTTLTFGSEWPKIFMLNIFQIIQTNNHTIHFTEKGFVAGSIL